MKKYFYLIIAFVFAASLCACTGNTDDDSAIDTPTSSDIGKQISSDADVSAVSEKSVIDTEKYETVSFEPKVNRIQGNGTYTYALTSEGSLIASSEPFTDGDNVVKTLTDYLSWENIKNFSTSSEAIAAVFDDGTVSVCGGLVDETQYSDFDSVNDWSDIVQVAMGKSEIVGLKADGSVVMAGEMQTEDLSDYEGFIQVESGSYPMGVKNDGTVVVWKWYFVDSIDEVNGWTDIIYVSSTYNHIVGLKSDGTVVACGNNDNGQCNVDEWTDIIAVSTGYGFTLGLKSDGTAVACGNNENGACDVSEWIDITEIDAGYHHSVGLKSDGTILCAGGNWQGQCDLNGTVLK